MQCLTAGRRGISGLPTFRDLSILLEQQIDALVGLQSLVISMHKTLVKLNPQFEETCKGVLESLKRGKGKEQDQMKMWQGHARKTLAKLAAKQ